MKKKLGNMTIRVMTYNIHHAQGMDGNINLDRATLIHSAKVVQEVDRYADRSCNLDMIKKLRSFNWYALGIWQES